MLLKNIIYFFAIVFAGMPTIIVRRGKNGLHKIDLKKKCTLVQQMIYVKIELNISKSTMMNLFIQFIVI